MTTKKPRYPKIPVSSWDKVEQLKLALGLTDKEIGDAAIDALWREREEEIEKYISRISGKKVIFEKNGENEEKPENEEKSQDHQ